jgi:hypothetical protein
LFFNFAVLFDFGCCSLAQEMSFVVRQQLITSLLSVLLPFQALFTESSLGDQLLAPPSFSCVFSASLPLCCVLVFSSLFLVQFFVLWGPGELVCPGGYAGLSQGWLGKYCVMLVLTSLVC